MLRVSERSAALCSFTSAQLVICGFHSKCSTSASAVSWGLLYCAFGSSICASATHFTRFVTKIIYKPDANKAEALRAPFPPKYWIIIIQMCVPASCWRPHGRTRPGRFPPSSARLGPTGRSPLRPRSWWTPARPAVCLSARLTGGWLRYCWLRDCWARRRLTAYCWLRIWAMTICWFTSWGLMGVDTRPGCRLGSWARPGAWLLWDRGTGTGTARPCCPGWAADWSWGGWFQVEKDQTDCPSQL